MNYHFTTTKEHMEINGGKILEIYTDEALKIKSSHPFKGNIDVEKFKGVVEEYGADRISFVRMEASTNLIGGQPFSIQNMRDVKKIADEHNIMFVLDANIANDIIVAARTAEGVTLFLVDAKASGVAIQKMQTIGMDNNCVVTLDNVRVSTDAMVGRPGEGWAILEQATPRATVAKCAEMLGGCEESIAMTTAYAKERVQYSTPIGGFQAIQHYMADMRIAYDTSIYYLHKVVWMLDQGMDTAKEVSALKAQVNEQYKFITERAVQIHGGIGTTREFNIGLFYRRAKAFEYILGDTDYHMDKLADALGL